MSSEKKLSGPKTSIYEAVRQQLGLRKFEMAQLLGHNRQWYTAKCRPLCRMTAGELYELWSVSKMSPFAFIELLGKVTSGER